MSCGKCGNRILKQKDGEELLQVPTCTRNISICGSINLPQGFRLSDKGDLHVGINACLECRTENVNIECTSDAIDNCGPVSGIIQAQAIRAVGCFNYVISVPVESTCPATLSYVTLENSACVDQVVCLQDSMFECDPVRARCDIDFIFLGVRQVVLEDCTAPTRFDVRATFRLFRNICTSPTSESIPESSQFDRVKYPD